jgi:hypothetical protein
MLLAAEFAVVKIMILVMLLDSTRNLERTVRRYQFFSDLQVFFYFYLFCVSLPIMVFQNYGAFGPYSEAGRRLISRRIGSSAADKLCY